ncbi:MAG: hypothetical protein EXR51_05520 [Dehalococcoidia bacterium]|nr:hypothetical protein [Dehalococcoidia bacterium]
MNQRPFPFSLTGTAIGSMPHTDTTAAVAAVVGSLPELPAWPQLVHRSPLEHMVPQFLEGFPGALMDGERVLIPGHNAEHGTPLLSEDRAAGWAAFLRAVAGRHPLGLKGQVTGPLTTALSVGLQDGRSLFRDIRVVRRIAHHLGRVAAFQEQELRRHSPHTLMLFDEPLLVEALDSPYLGAGLAADLLTSAAVWLRGLKGIHCCANPPWPFLLRLPLDVISFDSYHYASTLRGNTSLLGSFLERGGVIAWGMVPASDDELARESAPSLAARVEDVWSQLNGYGLDPALLRQQSLITPACGLAHVTEANSIRALNLTRSVAQALEPTPPNAT